MALAISWVSPSLWKLVIFTGLARWVVMRPTIVVSIASDSATESKGQNNRKNGNVYLGWAFVEAAHSIIRHNKTTHRFYQRKCAQRNGALATKALAHKLARACYYVMRDQAPFQAEQLFGKRFECMVQPSN